MDEMLPRLLSLAIEAARAPTELILSGFRSDRLTAERKPDGSPVTKFDREAEQMIRAFIAAHQPVEWPVLGEEFGGEFGDEVSGELGDEVGGEVGGEFSDEVGGEVGDEVSGEVSGTHAGSAQYRWVIDPIDGTLAFSRGLPTFGTLLAFEEVATRRSLVGVIHLPAMGETYSAARGHGAWCNGKRIHVAPSRGLRDCVISAPSEYHFRIAGISDSHEQLRAQAPHLRCLADCWAHAMVARGALDALAEFHLARWDIAATEVIIEEAGGLALTRIAPYDTSRKFDTIIGSPAAAREVASIIRF